MLFSSLERGLLPAGITCLALACARPDTNEARPNQRDAAPALTSVGVTSAARPASSIPPASVPSAPSSAPPPALAPSTAAAEPPPADPGRADLDPTNDTLIAPPDVIVDCDARLAAANLSVKPAELPLRKAKGGHQCGAPQVVVYGGVPGGARIRPTPMVTCGMALALARFETILQEEAERELGSRVVSITQAGTYNCREMARFDLVSEHSYANAIDLKTFTLANGRQVSVERHFGRPGTDPKTAESRFLRTLAHRLYDEGVFSVVLTEYFDRLHRDHFHLDMARYRVDGTRSHSEPELEARPPGPIRGGSGSAPAPSAPR